MKYNKSLRKIFFDFYRSSYAGVARPAFVTNYLNKQEQKTFRKAYRDGLFQYIEDDTKLVLTREGVRAFHTYGFEIEEVTEDSAEEAHYERIMASLQYTDVAINKWTLDMLKWCFEEDIAVKSRASMIYEKSFMPVEGDPAKVMRFRLRWGV